MRNEREILHARTLPFYSPLGCLCTPFHVVLWPSCTSFHEVNRFGWQLDCLLGWPIRPSDWLTFICCSLIGCLRSVHSMRWGSSGAACSWWYRLVLVTNDVIVLMLCSDWLVFKVTLFHDAFRVTLCSYGTPHYHLTITSLSWSNGLARRQLNRRPEFESRRGRLIIY